MPGTPPETVFCPQCGAPRDPTRESQLCAYHTQAVGETAYSDTWAYTNKVWCDRLHRGVPIPRLYPQPMTDDVWLFDKVKLSPVEQTLASVEMPWYGY